MATPPTWKEIRILLGRVNYQRHFTKDFYLLSTPLVPYAQENQLVRWTAEAEEAFHKLKSMIR